MKWIGLISVDGYTKRFLTHYVILINVHKSVLLFFLP